MRLCYTFSMMNTEVLLHPIWQTLSQQTLQHVYQLSRHTWVFLCRGRRPIALLIDLTNTNPGYAMHQLEEKPNLEAWQPHALETWLKDSQIQSCALDAHQRIECLIRQGEKNLHLLFQLTPYAPRILLIQENTVIFDTVHGWHPKDLINPKLAPILSPMQLNLKTMMAQALSETYRQILNQSLVKKQRRQAALQQDYFIHERNLAYQAIAEAMQLQPNLAWSQYPNPNGLPQPSGQFKTDFAGVNLLYALYKKAKQGLIEVEKQRNENEKQMHHLQALLAMPLPDSESQLNEFKSYLIKHHLLSGTKTKPTPVDHRSPYFIEDKGMRYSFGKNAKQNDHLTFEIAKKSDIFLHIEGKPGSHVIIHHHQFDHDMLVRGAQLVLALAKQMSGTITYAKVGSLKRTKILGQVLVKDAKTIKVNADPNWTEMTLKETQRY